MELLRDNEENSPKLKFYQILLFVGYFEKFWFFEFNLNEISVNFVGNEYFFDKICINNEFKFSVIFL